MRSGSVYCGYKFWSATQTPCVNEFLNCLGSEGLNIFADDFLPSCFIFFHSEKSFCFCSHPVGQKVLPFE